LALFRDELEEVVISCLVYEARLKFLMLGHRFRARGAGESIKPGAPAPG